MRTEAALFSALSVACCCNVAEPPSAGPSVARNVVSPPAPSAGPSVARSREEGAPPPREDLPRSAYSDCDPTKRNSDGSLKRVPPGPADRPNETLVLSYDDFAPQASAFKVIGFQWWAWEGGGSWQQCDDFDIRVVVFWGSPIETVKQHYPTATSMADVERGLADYRFLERDEALAHLDAELAEIAGAPELQNMARRLAATRQRIVDALGP